MKHNYAHLSSPILRSLLLLILVAGSLVAAQAADTFVRANGKNLYGRDGKAIILRGTNCGNWMIREPYMMGTSGNLDRQYKFDKMIADICGPEKVQEFDRMWMDNLFGEEDMKFLADQGFNTLRVPMHYKYFTLPIEKEPVPGQQTWLDEGFTRIDSMCVWAERYGILLILDMHACPGGQSVNAICDHDETKPSLWESEANRTKLIQLWRKIAGRYATQKCIAGYDLINETSWPFENNNQLLWDLTKAIIKAIREVDKNHIVIIEGNGYCNDYNGFPSTKMDTKMMLQFHHYWHYSTKDCIQWNVNLGNKYSCPIYIGEFGENSNAWVGDHVRIFEEVGMCAAWTVWPMKKPALNTFLGVNKPAAYDNVISKYQSGTTPSATELWNGLVAFAKAQHISKCTVRQDYIDALLHLGFNKPLKPYKEMTVGDYIYCADYDFGKVGEAYWDTDVADYHSSEDGQNTNWNRGWTYRNDGVDLYAASNDTKTCGYYVGQTEDGEWLQYTIQNPNPAAKWRLQLRYALNSGSSTVRITVNDREVVAPTKLSSTGGHTSWMTKSFTGIILPEGTLRVRVYIEKGGANLNWLRFYSMSDATEEELRVLEPDGTFNRLSSGQCEYQGAWRMADLGVIKGAKATWGVTTDTPSQGEGGALRLENMMANRAFNCALYQPIEVVSGHTYRADVALRGATTNKDIWIQAFVVDKEPVNYADLNLDKSIAIGDLSSSRDASLTAYDGLMSAKAQAGSSHKSGVMTWKATTTGTMYFVLKVGTSSTQGFRYAFDNFTLIDETDKEDGIGPLPQPLPRGGGEIYNLAGQRLQRVDGHGIYITNGKKITY